MNALLSPTYAARKSAGFSSKDMTAKSDLFGSKSGRLTNSSASVEPCSIDLSANGINLGRVNEEQVQD